MHVSPIRESTLGVEVDVLVVPNASSASVVGIHGDRVKIRVTSPPEKNKANAAVMDLMRQVTGVRRAEVIRGRTGRHKTVLLIGTTADVVRDTLTTDDRFQRPGQPG
jgi:hypothetical protein